MNNSALVKAVTLAGVTEGLECRMVVGEHFVYFGGFHSENDHGEGAH